MKKKFYLLSFVITIISCKKEAPKDYILFSGTITDAPSKEFKLSQDGGKGRFTVKTAEDGSFISDTIFSGTGKYRFSAGGFNRIDLYFVKGGEYNLTTEGKDMKNSSVLTGKSSNATKYLLTKSDHSKDLRGDFAAYSSLNESEFSAKALMIKENLIKYLDSFPDLPKDFVQIERQELINSHILSLIGYENLHTKMAKKPGFQVSKSFVKQLEDVDYTNEEAYKQRGSYANMVFKYFRFRARGLALEEGVNFRIARLKVLGAISNDYIRNDLLIKVAQSNISGIDDIDAFYNTFISLSSSEENNKKITEKYKVLKKLSRGEPSPVFTDYVNHAGGTSSLSDFKGKYVYIDVWATWCGPCLAEVSSLKKVEKKYHGKNIEFVSISIDIEKKYDAWRKLVIDKELSGTQLLADKGWDTDFIKEYQINGIPRFILIDPKGNIISTNAPRPSNNELISLFNELGI